MDLITDRYKVKAISGFPLTPYSKKWRLRAMNGARVAGWVEQIDTWLTVLCEGEGPPYLVNSVGPDGIPRGFFQSCSIPFGISGDGTTVGLWSDGRYPLDGWQGFVRRPDGSGIYLGAILETEQSGLLCISDSGLKAAGSVGGQRGHGIGAAVGLFSFVISTRSVVRHDITVRWSDPVRINDDGDIVGNTMDHHGFLVKGGAHTDLGAGIFATRITNSGMMAGNSPSGAWIAHSSRPLDVQTLIPGFWLNDISEDGRTAVGNGPGGANIWTARLGLRNLNMLLERFTPWYLASARFINAAGHIVGEGDSEGLEGPLNFLASPYPERTHLREPLQPDLLWPIWLELPQARPPLDPAGQDLMRALMIHQLASSMPDQTSRSTIRAASLRALEQALERIRRSS
jgi:hypothetical protein